VEGEVNIQEGAGSVLGTPNIKIVSHVDKSIDEGFFSALDYQSLSCSVAGSACTASNKPSGCGSTSDFTSAPHNIDSDEWQIKAGSSGLTFTKCKQYTVQLKPKIGSNYYGKFCDLTINVVNVNDPPTWNGNTLTQTRNVAERSKINVEITPAISAVDSDIGQELTYELIDDGNGMFRIGSCTGIIYVAKDAMLDHATQASYELKVKVTDDPTFFSPASASGLSIQESVYITVVNVNDPPTFISSDRFSIAEIGATQTASVEPQTEDLDNNPLTYTIVDTSGVFTIGVFTGIMELLPNKVLDYEMQKVYDVTITISDTLASTSQMFTIDVLDSNDQPTIPSNLIRTIPENSIVDTVAGTPFSGFDIDTNLDWGDLLYSIQSGNTGDTFKLSQSNNIATIQVKTANIDYEVKNKYTLKMRVTDCNGNAKGSNNLAFSKYDEADVIVNIMDVNEQPTMNVSLFELSLF
jgi:hypothetical protein